MTGRVYLATPATRAPEWEHVFSLVGMDRDGIIYDVLPNMALDVGRNILIARFLDSKYDPEWLLFVDSDATWPPGAIERLLSRDKDVISGMVYKRGLPPVPTMGVKSGEDAEGHTLFNFGYTVTAILKHAELHNLDDNVNDAVLLPETTDDLLPIDGCGTHFMLLRRPVLEAIKPPWFRQYTAYSAGEDFYFCDKIRQAGFQLWADLSVHTGHIAGPGIEFGIREFLAFYKYNPVLKATMDANEAIMDVGKFTA
jgi:GT2 family glycosyltransferase